MYEKEDKERKEATAGGVHAQLASSFKISWAHCSSFLGIQVFGPKKKKKPVWWLSASENLAGTTVLLPSAQVLAVSDKFPNLSEQEIHNSHIIKSLNPVQQMTTNYDQDFVIQP